MPSDDRTASALAALAPARDRYRSALAATLDEVRVWLDTHQSAAADQVAQLATELGPVGARHVDAAKLSAALGLEPVAEPVAQRVIPRALRVLRSLWEAGDELFVVELGAGVNLYRAVDVQLAGLGRAMGAARVVDLARSGRYNPAVHEAWLEAFPFGQWSQAERELAPPLVVELAGADLRAAALAEFLDGGVKIVLVARGETSPAPLVRLVAPRTFVAQDSDPAMLPRLVAWNGPGIAALLPNGAARFVHDPSLAGPLGARLTVSEVPALDPKRRAGPFTVPQQRDELDQLRALQSATTAPSATPAGPAVSPTEPVDRLAAWLLQQADLAGVA